MEISNGDAKWVVHPDLTLEDVREHDSANECSGRGSETAAARGYNAERLATAVFSSNGRFNANREHSWFDTKSFGKNSNAVRIESKSCIDRYPSGGYGQFRIWAIHHNTMIEVSSELSYETYVYFFLVYTIEDGDAYEVGKLAADPHVIDDLLSNWRSVRHSTKGTDQVRDISWRQLLSRLGVSVDQFREENIVVVTDSSDE